MSGDYVALDELMNKHIRAMGDLPDGGSQFAGIAAGMSDLFRYGGMNIEQVMGRTADWRRRINGSDNPDIIEAMAFGEWAWAARGGGYANSVSSQSWAVFAYRTEMAAATLEDIAGRASSNPLWYQLSIDLGLDRSLPSEDIRKLFDSGHSLFPEYFPLYRSILRTLMPRWGGSYEMVDRFIKEMSSGYSTTDGLERYPELYSMYATLEGDDQNIFETTSADWQSIRRGFDRMMIHYPNSDVVLNRFANITSRANDVAQYSQLRPLVDKGESLDSLSTAKER